MAHSDFCASQLMFLIPGLPLLHQGHHGGDCLLRCGVENGGDLRAEMCRVEWVTFKGDG